MHIYQVKWGWYPPSLSKVESAYTEFLPSKVTLGYSRKNQDGGGGIDEDMEFPGVSKK